MRFAAAGRVTIAVASDFMSPAQPDGKKSVLVSDSICTTSSVSLYHSAVSISDSLTESEMRETVP